MSTAEEVSLQSAKPPALEMISRAYRNQLVGSASLAKLSLKVWGLFCCRFPLGSFPTSLVSLADGSYTPTSVGICVPVAGRDKTQYFSQSINDCTSL